MDVIERRKVIIAEILERQFGGRNVDLAEAVGVAPSTVSRWISGRKGIGEKKAREIEVALELPRGTLLEPTQSDTAKIVRMPTPWPFSVARERFDRLTPVQKAKINGVLEGMVTAFEAEPNRPPARRRG